MMSIALQNAFNNLVTMATRSFCHDFVMNGIVPYHYLHAHLRCFACSFTFFDVEHDMLRHVLHRPGSPSRPLWLSWKELMTASTMRKIHIWVFAWLSLENFAVGFNDYIYSLKLPAVLAFHWCWLLFWRFILLFTLWLYY